MIYLCFDETCVRLLNFLLCRLLVYTFLFLTFPIQIPWIENEPTHKFRILPTPDLVFPCIYAYMNVYVPLISCNAYQGLDRSKYPKSRPCPLELGHHQTPAQETSDNIRQIQQDIKDTAFLFQQCPSKISKHRRIEMHQRLHLFEDKGKVFQCSALLRANLI